MRNLRLYACALLLVVAATNSDAALSKEYADFPKGPAQHLLTEEERTQWKNIKSDDAAKAFIDLFWARRDPSPGTAANESRDLFDRLVQTADGNFREPAKKGSLTDRGKVFILMGGPTRILRSGSGPKSTIQTPAQMNTTGGMGTPSNSSSVQDYSPKELWTYEQAKVQYTLGQPIAEIAFIDQYGSGDYKMEKVNSTDNKSLFERIAKNAWITQPNLTEVPQYASAAPVALTASAPVALTTTAAVAPAKLTAFSSDTLRVAIDEARASKAASDALFLSYGEFITAEGEHFVPVQLYAPKSAGLTAGPGMTFFGSVVNEVGEQVAIYEEPATLVASNDDVFYAKSIALGPGKYTGVFGLAKDGKPVSVIAKPIVVQGLDKAAPGVSRLLLSGNVYPLSEAQLPTDPFAFGGLKVVPRSNQIFRQAEDLWYFVETRNPGIDPATTQPKISMKVTINGKTNEDKPVKIAGPAEVVQPIELKGVTGHWGVGQAIPLATIKPGTYTMTVKITDMTLDKSYEVSETFKVVQ
ncbi:MAG TPA: GWxTD domain-containing protein [Thermoanaerobaculia bacterium]|nr:GWxTD domain-containing protein [Thermoanaerobaculia bacterium]